MKDIILFGIQGSGKGTQGRLLSEKYGYVSYSTGEALRDHMERKTEIGKRAAVFYDAGNLVPDDILIELLEDFFSSIDQGKPVIFDGVPRTLVQKKAFDQVITEYGREFVGVIIDLSEAEAIRRITLRGETENRSDDQDIEVVHKRFENFREKTMPIALEYEAAGNLVHVNGEQSVEEVQAELVAALQRSGAL